MSQEAPAGVAKTTITHRVAFYETDAMGIVHHSNHIRFFELARVAWMNEHHCPYTDYMALGLNFATTVAAAEYLLPIQFDREIEVDAWLEWARGASIRIAYVIRDGGEIAATGATEHAMVDEAGRPRRIPRDKRAALAKLAATPENG